MQEGIYCMIRCKNENVCEGSTGYCSFGKPCAGKWGNKSILWIKSQFLLGLCVSYLWIYLHVVYLNFIYIREYDIITIATLNGELGSCRVRPIWSYRYRIPICHSLIINNNNLFPAQYKYKYCRHRKLVAQLKITFRIWTWIFTCAHTS